MSKVQDIFGASPKSVLNKPFMHVQDQKPTGTDGGGSVTGDNKRDLNTVLTNEISGAVLSDNSIILPAGEYYIDAYMGAAQSQSGYGLNCYLKDSTSGVKLLIGTNAAQSGQAVSQVTNLKGRFVLPESTTVEIGQNWQGPVATNGLGRSGDVGPYEVYSEALIWKLDSTVETPVISDPTLTLARPLMHVEHRETTGTNGGSSSAGDTDRTLNTTVTNEIVGATLSSNQITLPAGEYYIEADACMENSNAEAGKISIRTTADAVLLTGQGGIVATGRGQVRPCSGRITLADTTALKLVSTTVTAEANTGLGHATGFGPHETYASVRIWQIDAVVKQPVLVNDKLYPLPGNVIVTGNMHGLEYEYTAPNNITVQAGICMDSTNETVLTLTNPQLVTIPNGVDTVYNLFLTDDGQQVKTDTDVDGANLPAQDKRRWIGFVRTRDDGTIASFTMAGDTIWLTTAALLLATSNTAFSTGDFMPLSRTRSFSVITASTNAHRDVELKRDNSSGYTMAACNGGPTAGTPSTLDGVPPHPIYYWETGSACDGVLRSVTMKR